MGRRGVLGLVVALAGCYEPPRDACTILCTPGAADACPSDQTEIATRLRLKALAAVDDKIGSIRFYPDGGSNGGRITVASGERKFEVDVDWLTGRVAILD